MSKPKLRLPYTARARLADNIYVHRKRAGLSLAALAQLAGLTAGRLGQMERGVVGGTLDTYIRLAGALGVSLDDLLAGVSWTPVVIESEVEGGYIVEVESEAP